MPLHLHIEHLILEGAPFPGSDSRAFRAALERELTDLTASIETDRWTSARRTSANAPEISPNPQAEACFDDERLLQSGSRGPARPGWLTGARETFPLPPIPCVF
jgi:hypothetical protein